MNKIKIKKGDQVVVVAGENKGAKGTVLKILYNSNKAIVEGVNTVKRHTKPNSENPKGGIVEKQLPINISNLSLMTKDGEKTRVGYKVENGKKVRISKKSKEII
jgi:large subunit ribosomal protein L24